jgi:hypothetical protein
MPIHSYIDEVYFLYKGRLTKLQHLVNPDISTLGIETFPNYILNRNNTNSFQH